MKRTIGLLVNTFYDEYEATMWEGIKQSAKKNKYNLLCFIGGSLNNPYFDNKTRNAVYDFVNNTNVDGIIAISVSIGSYIDKKALHSFLNSFSPLPMVSIGIPLPAIPSIVINNSSGMKELVRHLIHVHNYKRIALIRGPKMNNDADARFEAYKEILLENSISINPNLIVEGSFHVNSGKSAVIQLLDERHESFDVIIGANDYVAINAIAELQNRGIKVPEDVAVVGFDDVIESQFLEYPLTTVHQPSYHVGYEAAQMLVSLLDKKTISLQNEIPGELIVRQSCGCDGAKMNSSIDHLELKDINEKIRHEEFIPALVDIMKVEFEGAMSMTQLCDLAGRLFTALISELKGEPQAKFLICFKNIINEVSRDFPGLVSWYTIMSFLFMKIVPELSLPCNRDREFTLFSHILTIIDTISIKNYKQIIIQANEREMHLYSIKKMLHTVFTVRMLKEIIVKEFPLLGLQGCSISVFRDNKRRIPGNPRNLTGNKEDTYVPLYSEKERFDTVSLLQWGSMENSGESSRVMLSLSFKKELLGFVIFESDTENGTSSTHSLSTKKSVYEILTIELSNTIKSIMLFHQVEEETKFLEKSMDDLDEQDDTLSLPEEKLQEYFRKLLLYMDTEKPYVDLDLTLPDLAEQLDIPRNHLSYVINKYSKVNFYGFINSYRIKEAKQILEQEYKEKINILDVAYNSGFKSKSTFYKIFRKFTHVTPTDYRRNYLDVKKNV